ncbi:MAG: 2-phosphosulfolactate phosphatase [Chthoniobacteraceae bacterium]
MKLDAALTPADISRLPERDLSGTTCVVFDVLRATSSMITALANGAAEIFPAKTIEEARTLRKEMPDALLGGERQGERIEGFDLGNNPFEYTALAGKRIISTTTNGTIALRACERAGRVLVGALLNIAALRDELARSQPVEVLLVCAGTFETFSLEDAIAAGLLAAEFPDAELTDAAIAVLGTAGKFSTPLEGLLAARNGRALAVRGWRDQIEWCSQVSRFDVIGAMDGRIIRSL